MLVLFSSPHERFLPVFDGLLYIQNSCPSRKEPRSHRVHSYTVTRRFFASFKICFFINVFLRDFFQVEVHTFISSYLHDDVDY